MNKIELQKRTKDFAIEVIALCNFLPSNRVGWTMCDQLIRSSTSVAANYRAVCRAKSDKDFISKLNTVIEEADESLFWLELIEETRIVNKYEEIIRLKTEANELVAIFTASAKTVSARISSKM